MPTRRDANGSHGSRVTPLRGLPGMTEKGRDVSVCNHTEDHMRLTADSDANADLPPVVRARITALQDHSERLIGWIQLAIVILFGVL
jgi:hypothetical protein